MKCKKVGVYVFCSALSVMLCICDNVNAMRRVSAMFEALSVEFMQDASALDGIRAAQSVHDLVAVPNANLHADLIQEVEALADMRYACSVHDLAAVPNANLHADFMTDAAAFDRIREAESFEELATVLNANLHGNLSYRLQFARALITGDFYASLDDNAWTVDSFGEGKLANDRLATFFKANYGKNAYNAGDLAGFDSCFAIAGTAIADLDDVAQVWGDVQYARGFVDETLAGLRAIGGILNYGGRDDLAPVFDALMEQLVRLSMQ